MGAAYQGDVVREFVAAKDREIWQEMLVPRLFAKLAILQTHLSRVVGDYVEAVVIPLKPEFVSVRGLKTWYHAA